MIRPDADTLKAIAAAAKTNPAFVQWLADWRTHELEKLPHVASGSVGIAQGRCQVLTELYKLMQDSPNMAAELRSK